MHIEPVTLEGTSIRLVPLSLAHHAEMCEVGLDQDLWRLTTTLVRTPADMQTYIEAALKAQAAATALPFATIEKASSQVVGSSRYGNIDPANRRLEIGWTWVAPPWQRTLVNTDDHPQRAHPAFRVFQHRRFRMAGCQGEAGGQDRPLVSRPGQIIVPGDPELESKSSRS